MPDIFATVDEAKAYSPSVAPSFMMTAGYSAAGDGGGALYKKVSTQPSHTGKFSITLSGGGGTIWYELAESNLSPEMFGAKGDGATNDAISINAALAFAAGGSLRFGRGKTYKCSATLAVPADVDMGGHGAVLDFSSLSINAPALNFAKGGAIRGATIKGPGSSGFVASSCGIKCSGMFKHNNVNGVGEPCSGHEDAAVPGREQNCDELHTSGVPGSRGQLGRHGQPYC